MNLIDEVETNLEKLLGSDLLAKYQKSKRRVYIRISKNRVKDVANYFKSFDL
jgi:hypothetical protein